jgi:acyl-CoA hydrolase
VDKLAPYERPVKVAATLVMAPDCHTVGQTSIPVNVRVTSRTTLVLLRIENNGATATARAAIWPIRSSAIRPEPALSGGAGRK